MFKNLLLNFSDNMKFYFNSISFCPLLFVLTQKVTKKVKKV